MTMSSSSNKQNRGVGGGRSTNNRGGGRRGRGGRGGVGGGRSGGKPSSGRGNKSPSNKTPHRSNSNGSSTSRTRHSAATAPSTKKDGDLGAASHTVSEEYRIQLTQVLMNLRETDNQDSITMPPDLTNTQRKFVHELARQLGLKSKSYGKGEERRVVISKILAGAGGMNSMMGSFSNDQNGRRDDDDPPLAEDYKNVPRIVVGKSGEDALRRHLKLFPTTPLEQAESKETGSFMLMKDDGVVQDYGTINDVLKTSQESFPQERPKEKTTHEKLMQQRISNHRIAQDEMKANPQYKKMMEQRKKLPAFAYATDICSIVRNKNNRVIILTGDTGCGKSTQVPQFLLDDPEIGPQCSIIVTQPRRISAISVAERVAQERCEPAGNSVGFSVRLESSMSKKTQLLFVTPGVLMKKLHPDSGDNTSEGGRNRLDMTNIIIMDEIHERDKNTEFLMIALQDLIEERNDLQLILMSATMPTRDLAEYWRGVGTRQKDKCNSPSLVDDDWGDEGLMPVEINIPGRTYPVQEFFLEDILMMTGFVDDNANAPDMLQIDADLTSLLSATNQFSITAASTSMPTLIDSTLKCIMCNKSGFSSAEELGSHIAVCCGGGEESMADLEERIRGISIFDSYVSVPEAEDVAAAGVGDDLFDIMENELEDYDDVDDEVLVRKWDGESSFDAGLSSKLTLTEEESLMRYQTMYDDDEVNYDLLLELVRYIDKSSYGDGAVLVFFSGWREISEFALLLETTLPFNDPTKYNVHLLHSGIPSKDQRKVFVKPSRGVRKIVLSTNIAETSVTIEDVAFVIDTGRAKLKSYDPHLKTSTLQDSWISQASAKQRRGRAGRCKAGVCFHLFSRRRHGCMRAFLESELLRTPLEELCLQTKRLNLANGGPDDPDGIPAFLSKAMSPPHSKSITNALELLVNLGAMDEETNELTDLGVCLSALSLEPKVGKMLIMSHLIGCTREAACMAVAMNSKSPFTIPPPHMRKLSDNAKVILSEGSESDQITFLNVIHRRDAVAKRGMSALTSFCRQHYLNASSLNQISNLRTHVSRELESLGFPPCSKQGYHNRNGDSPAFLQASICAGLYPNVAWRRKGDVNFSTITRQKAKTHLSSVNAVKSQPLSTKCQVAENEVELVVFGELVKGKMMFTMDNTTHLVSPLPLLLLCGDLHVRPITFAATETSQKTTQSLLSVDEWLVFLCDPTISSALVVLRNRINAAFKSITSDPSTFADLPAKEKDAVDTLSTVLQSGHRQYLRQRERKR
ncbi:hypothetical protein ACHAWT_006480 [Skeletonema menzelii]